MDRPKVSVFLATSLDGFLAGPGGDLSWLEPYATDDPCETGYARLVEDIDTVVMGRNTWEKVLSFGFWPYPGKRAVVLTHRPCAPRYGEEAHAGPLRTLLERLQAQGARHVYLDGGHVVRQALADGFVDELTLSWAPLVLGGGIPLFDARQPPSTWVAEAVRRLPSGLVQTVYRHASRCEPAAHGEVHLEKA